MWVLWWQISTDRPSKKLPMKKWEGYWKEDVNIFYYFLRWRDLSLFKCWWGGAVITLTCPRVVYENKSQAGRTGGERVRRTQVEGWPRVAILGKGDVVGTGRFVASVLLSKLYNSRIQRAHLAAMSPQFWAVIMTTSWNIKSLEGRGLLSDSHKVALADMSSAIWVLEVQALPVSWCVFCLEKGGRFIEGRGRSLWEACGQRKKCW